MEINCNITFYLKNEIALTKKKFNFYENKLDNFITRNDLISIKINGISCFF